MPAPNDQVRGNWTEAYLSPDRTRLLLLWWTRTRVSTIYLAPAAGGDPRRIARSAPVGWSRAGRPLVLVRRGKAGVYSADAHGRLTLVARGTDAALLGA